MEGLSLFYSEETEFTCTTAEVESVCSLIFSDLRIEISCKRRGSFNNHLLERWGKVVSEFLCV